MNGPAHQDGAPGVVPPDDLFLLGLRRPAGAQGLIEEVLKVFPALLGAHDLGPLLAEGFSLRHKFRHRTSEVMSSETTVATRWSAVLRRALA